MVEQKAISAWHSVGIVWVYAGWLGLLTTILFYSGIRFHLGKGDAVAAIILGGFPTLLLFLVALGRVYYARQKMLQSDNRMNVVRSAVIGLVCLGSGVGLLGIESHFRTRQDAKCVSEAQAVVESYLQQHSPSGMNVFQGMTGDGYDYPPPWSPGGYYLKATRSAHFANGTLTVEIIICPTSGSNILIESVEKQGRFVVLHPKLKE